MRYDISKATAPMMPNLGKGTECIKILLSQASKDMYEPLVPMLFPILGAHINAAEFTPKARLKGGNVTYKSVSHPENATGTPESDTLFPQTPRLSCHETTLLITGNLPFHGMKSI